MRTSIKKWRRSVSLLGACTVGVFALGFALELKGESGVREAAPSEISQERPLVRTGPNSIIVEVDYRDDEGTRLRQAGLLKGPLPLVSQTSNVAGGSCTFAIDCVDGDPCTTDSCDIAPGSPLGSGICVHQPVADGNTGGCSDGQFCNGFEFCQGGACTAGVAPVCCAGRDFCNEVFGRCDADSANVGTKCLSNTSCSGGLCNFCLTDCRDLQCNYQSAPEKIGISCEVNGECTDDDHPNGQCVSDNNACTDGLACNGAETCNVTTGICEEGINPCGFGANCSEFRCTGAGGRACTPGGEACPGANTCTLSPGCFYGRCCSNAAEPVCSNAKLATAPAPLCTTLWYATDAGGLAAVTDPCGNDVPSGPGTPQGCPKYSSGITVSSVNDQPNWPVNIGPVSDATLPITVGTYTGALNRIGDDYTIVNGSHLGLDSIRWVGGLIVPNRILLELWDGSGNFIEDAVLPPIGANATPDIIVVNFVPRITIPPTGYVTWKIASNFSPNAQMYIMSADIEDAGVNDETELWLNSGPVSNFLTPNPGILAFEITGAKVAIPLGACCNDSGGCQETTEWICVGGGGVFQAGVGCSECVGGGNAGAACTRCGGVIGGAACTNDDDCSVGVSCLPTNAVCTGAGGTCSNNDETVCANNAQCPAIPNQCSNAVQFCTVNSECPFGGTCGGAGTCLFGTCALPGCNVGACCNAGVCTDQITEAQCGVLTGSILNFLGFGTTCDEDAGLDGAEQDCCPRPADASLTQGCDRTGAVCTSDAQCLNHNCFDTATCFTSATCTGGLCSAGPLANQECETDVDCDACNGGPLEGDSCVTNAECRACETGRYAGLTCSVDADCGNCADASPNDDNKYDADCDDGLCYTGADNPADAIVQAITVPASGSSPAVVTISGNNGSASSTAANPDTCWGEADSIGDEPGWFEAFSIDKEALVRLDFCCTKPVHEPAWAFLSENTDCSSLVGSSANPYRPQEQASARGPLYCNEDNLWQWFGPLAAGTYYYPIYSIVSGHVGQYQLHITVEPMPEGACCLPETDIEYTTDHCDDDDPDTTGITATECEARGGLFLGPPNRFPIVGLCSPGVCDTGSCCTGPGVCEDANDNAGIPINRTQCDNLNGSFVPHVLCEGGRCAQGIQYSCAATADCQPGAGGPGCPGSGDCCIGDPASLAQPNPCPICQYNSDATCQRDPGGFIGTAYVADRSSTVQPTRIADDVLITSTGLLEQICVIGEYIVFATDGNGNYDCALQPAFSGTTDDYQIRVYLPASATNYVPGQLLGSWSTMVAENQEEPEFISGGTSCSGGPSQRGCRNWWRQQLTLIPDGQNPLITLQANNVYFIEVSNNTQGGDPECNWLWLNAAAGEGNDLFYQDLGLFYTEADAEDGDASLCMNVAFETPETPVRACCTTDVQNPCVDATLVDCLAANGDWQFDQLTCFGFTCTLPENDNCSDAIVVSDGPVVFNTFGATIDGAESELCGATPTETGQQADVWYFYEASCTGTALISTCNKEYFGDEVVSVYTNTSNSAICACPGDSGLSLVECYDDDQDNPVNPTGCDTYGAHSDVVVPVVAGNCYTVRVSQFDSANVEFDVPFPENIGQLRITCGETGVDPFPVCGNNSREVSNGEQCDGSDDSLCPDECSVECLCPPPPCGDNVAVPELGQPCDGTDDAACPGNCTGQCTCLPICGNGTKEAGEQCDEPDDSLCPGACNPAGPDGCTCITVCGNGILELGEACDGLNNDDNCPGACSGQCECPAPTCGNDVVEALNNEECDGSATDGSGCDPLECRPPGDPAGECTCSCGAVNAAPDPLTGNTFGTCNNTGNAVCDTVLNNCTSPAVCEACNQTRYMGFKIPDTSAGSDTAIRIRLDALHNPVPPPVGTVPDFALIEGQDRYLNTLPGTLSRCCNPNSNPTSCNTAVSCTTNANCGGLGLNTTCYKNLCPDSTAFATFFRCARVGCTPEYRDWSDFAGTVTYATGDSVISSSSYSVSHLAASCAGSEASCSAASAALVVPTERWGNVDCSNPNFGIPNGQDIGRVVDKVKDAAGAFIKPRAHIRTAILDPASAVNAQDIGRIVDSVKGLQYPFNINCSATCTVNANCPGSSCVSGRCGTAPACSTTAQCLGFGLSAAHTCSANGRCTTAKDSCSGLCQP